MARKGRTRTSPRAPRQPDRRFRLTLRSATLGTEHPDLEKVQRFLTRFGYLTTTIVPGRLDKATANAIKVFQRAYGLKATGTLNPETVRALQAPRCGSPDVSTLARIQGGASSDFVLRGCDYNLTQLTFRFLNGTADIAGTQE